MKGQKVLTEDCSAFVGLDSAGLEHPDQRRVEIPTRLKLPQRQVDRVRSIIRQEMSRRAVDEGKESFEEADDFEIDDLEPFSPYEEVFEPNLTEIKENADRLGNMSSGRNGPADKGDDNGGGKKERGVDSPRGAVSQTGGGDVEEESSEAGGERDDRGYEKGGRHRNEGSSKPRK